MDLSSRPGGMELGTFQAKTEDLFEPRALQSVGFRARDSGLGVQSSGFRVQDLGVKIYRVQSSGFRVQDLGVKIYRVQS
jgi:hypothetical protein